MLAKREEARAQKPGMLLTHTARPFLTSGTIAFGDLKCWIVAKILQRRRETRIDLKLFEDRIYCLSFVPKIPQFDIF